MSIKLAAWNLQERLAVPEHSSQIVESIKALDADVAILSDAYWLGKPLHGADPDCVHAAREELSAEGYKAAEVAYNERRAPWSGRYLLALSRLEEATLRAASYGMYNMASFYARDPDTNIALRVFGTHGDDRSELNRISQVAYIESQTDLTQEPIALAGDLNALHGDVWQAKLLRSLPARIVPVILPAPKPRNEYERQNGRLSGLERLNGMAQGRTLRLLAQAGLRDADPKRQPTFPARRPLFQLDHILVNDFVHIADFAVHKAGGSDHLPVSAKLEL